MQSDADMTNSLEEDEIPELALDNYRSQAKTLFLAKKYSESYDLYEIRCLPICAFKDQRALIYANMSQCSLSLRLYERAFADL